MTLLYQHYSTCWFATCWFETPAAPAAKKPTLWAFRQRLRLGHGHGLSSTCRAVPMRKLCMAAMAAMFFFPEKCGENPNFLWKK